MGWESFYFLLSAISIFNIQPDLQNLQAIPQIPLKLCSESVLNVVYVKSNDEHQSYFYLDYGEINEYIFCTLDGLRQDFLLVDKPSCSDYGWVRLKLESTCPYKVAKVEDDFVILINSLTGKRIKYARLNVFDKEGNRFLAKFSIDGENAISILINDCGAKYPLYIDPTYLDEDWQSLSPNWTNGSITSIAKDSNYLYCAGAFTTINGVSANRVARWNGSQWQTMGQGFNGTVECLYIDSNGNLIACGSFTFSGTNQRLRIAKWNGSSWSSIGLGFNDTAYAIVESSNGKLFAGGKFTKSSDNNTNLNHIAYWDGSSWNEPSLGVGSSNDYVLALVSDSVGNIYVGGKFQTAGGIYASNIAKWNTTTSTWEALGSGLNGTVYALAIGPDGKIYVGGDFTTAGGSPASKIAIWDGSNWTTISQGLSSTVRAIIPQTNESVFVGGVFDYTGSGIGPNHLAWWYKGDWKSITSGISGVSEEVKDLLVDEQGNLFVAGTFYSAGGKESYNIAKLNKPPNFTLIYSAGEGGTIIGETNQSVMRGDDGTEVSAMPLQGYIFNQWSDGLTTPKRIDTNITENRIYTAYFLPSSPEGVIEGNTEGEGSIDGIDEGVAEGEGSIDGINEGTTEGDGIYDGMLEAENQEGTSDGYNEGLYEGTTEGIEEGTIEGFEEGLQDEGESEGYSEGEVQLIVWIDSPPIIDKEVGDTLSLLVKTSGEAGNLTYQWYREQNDKIISRLENQTQALLYIENLELNDTGWYWCEVTDNFSVALSNKIYLRVSEGLVVSSIFTYVLSITIISILLLLSVHNSGEFRRRLR